MLMCHKYFFRLAITCFYIFVVVRDRKCTAWSGRSRRGIRTCRFGGKWRQGSFPRSSSFEAKILHTNRNFPSAWISSFFFVSRRNNAKTALQNTGQQFECDCRRHFTSSSHFLIRFFVFRMMRFTNSSNLDLTVNHVNPNAVLITKFGQIKCNQGFLAIISPLLKQLLMVRKVAKRNVWKYVLNSVL